MDFVTLLLCGGRLLRVGEFGWRICGFGDWCLLVCLWVSAL